MKPRIRKINGRWRADILQELRAFLDALNAAQPRLFYLRGPAGTQMFATVDEVTDALLAQMPDYIRLSKRDWLLARLTNMPLCDAKRLMNPETKQLYYIWRD